MYGYVAHVAMHTLQTNNDMCVHVQANVATCVQGSSRMCTHFFADFIVCDMRVKHVSDVCGIELVANLYRS